MSKKKNKSRPRRRKNEFCLRIRRLLRERGLGLGQAGRGDLWQARKVCWQEWAKGAVGPRRDVLREEVVSNFKIASVKWMNVFWTPASSENTHSFIVQEMVIIPTPIKMGLEP